MDVDQGVVRRLRGLLGRGRDVWAGCEEIAGGDGVVGTGFEGLGTAVMLRRTGVGVAIANPLDDSGSTENALAADVSPVAVTLFGGPGWRSR